MTLCQAYASLSVKLVFCTLNGPVASAARAVPMSAGGRPSLTIVKDACWGRAAGALLEGVEVV